MTDGFKASLPSQVLDKVVEKAPVLFKAAEKAPSAIKSMVDSISGASSAILDFSKTEWSLMVGIPLFFAGCAIAFVICAICIPGKFKLLDNFYRI